MTLKRAHTPDGPPDHRAVTTTPVRAAKTSAPDRPDTRTRLLDSAEELFADRGYFAIGVREITDHARTRLAAVSEQFGGKEGLFRAVVLRRIQPLNEDRRALLAALPARGARGRRLRGLIEAFSDPMRRRAGDLGWSHYFRLIAQLANSGHPITAVVSDEFNSIAAEFIARLREIYPDVDDAALHDAYVHMVASVMHTYSNNMRLDNLTGGQVHTDDIEQRHRALVRFVEGGIAALTT